MNSANRKVSGHLTETAQKMKSSLMFGGNS